MTDANQATEQQSRPVMNSPADEAEARDRANTAPRQADPAAPRRVETGVSSGSEARPVTATEHLCSKEQLDQDIVTAREAYPFHHRSRFLVYSDTDNAWMAGYRAALQDRRASETSISAEEKSSLLMRCHDNPLSVVDEIQRVRATHEAYVSDAQEEYAALEAELADALKCNAPETSAVQGLRSISFEPRGAQVALLVCFDSLEQAQVARTAVTAALLAEKTTAHQVEFATWRPDKHGMKCINCDAHFESHIAGSNRCPSSALKRMPSSEEQLDQFIDPNGPNS